MKAIIKAKAILAFILRFTGITAWRLGKYANHNFLILTYHRVIPTKEKEISIQAGMFVEPVTLDMHVRYLKKYFEVIPLSDLVLSHQVGSHESQKKPYCVITFDDGWYDFYKYAYPILKTHGIPATVFLPTDFIGTDRRFWTDRIGLLLDRLTEYSNSRKSAPLFQNPLLSQIAHVSGTFEIRLEKVISLLKPYRIETIEQILSELTAVVSEDSYPMECAFLSWDEVLEMHASGLISFGSHTVSHPILTTLTDQEVKNELEKSRDALISHKAVDSTFIPFSYPNGNFSDRLCEMVREAGYHLAVTTQYGWNHQKANPYTLRRINIHQDMTSTEAMFASRIVNLL